MKILIVVMTSFCFSVVSAQDSLQIANRQCDAKVIPVLWQQHAAEYRALCYQAFNLAQCRLNETKIRKRRKYAIITDVDETVLDNSYYEAERIQKEEDFNQKSWHEWTSRSKATAISGAVEFLQSARRKGVEIFYISNRDTSEVESTIINLKSLGFPDADEAHMLFLKSTSSKEERRQAVLKDFKVILYLGDNLNDFMKAFEKKSNPERNAEAEKSRNEWGKTFIVLPNATYGEWENALYDYVRNLTPEQKRQRMLESLISKP